MIANAVGNSTGSSIPIGVVQAYSGVSAPSGWLLCDGSEVSRTTYTDLFAVIGESYGSGDGITTFNLPDLRGRIPVGKDDMGGSPAGRVLNNGNTLGNNGGEETHVLTEDEMPSHTHGYWGGTGSQWADYQTSFHVDRDPGPQTTDPAGGDQPHNNMQPYLITNYIIKVN